MTINLSAINPKKHPKYSPNLYKWLTHPDRKNSRLFEEIKVYRDSNDFLWIGYIDPKFKGYSEFLSARLYGVLCNGSKEKWSWRTGEGMVEVEGFWQKYEAIGRCAIDQNHEKVFTGDKTRWQHNGSTRHCQWCGQVTQRLHTWTEVVTKMAWRNVEGVKAQPAAPSS
jgi:hypothetical protein